MSQWPQIATSPRRSRARSPEEHRGHHLRDAGGRLPRRSPRREDGPEDGHKKIGVAGGLPIPPVNSYIAGYEFCAKKAVPGTKTVVQYSNDFVDQTKCATIAQNEISQGAQVIFQVAGICGDGALTKAGSLRQVGHRRGRRRVQRRSKGHILTSALKKTDVGVYNTIKTRSPASWQGGTNLLFNLKNNGVGVGKISPKVPACVDHADELVQDEDHQGDAQASGGLREQPC